MIVNYCFKNCIYPDLWKKSTVIPVPKCSRPSLKDFRPITLISIFAKVLEKIFVCHFKNDFINYFGVSQHAYRPHMSTATALAEYFEIIASALNNDKTKAVHVVFNDLSKAFDKIRHDLLVNMIDTKLGAPMAKFINSYLYGRSFKLRVGNMVSDSIDCVSSVPAGSVLGPFLFNFYLGDLIDTFNGSVADSKIVIYADDIVSIDFISTGNVETHVCDTVIKEWLSKYDLTNNLSKTKQMYYKKKNVDVSILPVINNIEIVKMHKHLGVILAEDFALKNHIDFVLSKASKAIFVLKYLCKMRIVTKKELMNVYNCLVLSHITYASTVLTHLQVADCNRINRLIDRCHKIICNVGCSCSAFLPIDSIVKKRNHKLFGNILKHKDHPLRTYLPIFCHLGALINFIYRANAKATLLLPRELKIL